jgi:integrase
LRVGDNTGKKRAIVPMNDRLKAALLEAYKARTCDYVVEYGGRKIKNVFKGFREAAKKAGVDASPHILRHSAAVWMAEAGVPMSEISQFLGHSSSKITETVYARYSPTYLSKAASALNF